MLSPQNISLAELPSDIIRKIIRIRPSLKSLQLISPRWNALGKEFLNDRTRLPVIKWFSWTKDQDFLMCMSMRVSEQYSEYFGADSAEMTQCSDNVVKVTKILDLCHMPEDFALNRISRFLSRCSKVERFEFSAKCYQDCDEMTRTDLGFFKADELSIVDIRGYVQGYDDFPIDKGILQFINDHVVQRLFLNFTYLNFSHFDSRHFTKFLTAATDRIPIIEINVQSSQNTRAVWEEKLSAMEDDGYSAEIDNETAPSTHVKIIVRAIYTG